METMERKKPRPRRAFTDEFKTDIVERCLKGRLGRLRSQQGQ